MPEPIQIFFLGTGGSTPFSGRLFPCIALKYLGNLVLFDVGECCQFSLMAQNVHPLRHNIFILISHYHADHTSGLPGLLHTFNLMEMQNKVVIIGPKGLQFVLYHIIHGFLIPQPNYPIEVIEVDNVNDVETVYEGDKFTIKVFPTVHSVPSLGYVFKEKDKVKFDNEKAEALGVPRNNLRRILIEGNPIKIGDKIIKPEDVIKGTIKGRQIVYSGDTRPSELTVKAATSADLLIHEATYLDPNLASSRLHSSLDEVLELARSANVKRLAIVHVSARHEIEEYLLTLSSRQLDFEVIIPKDGDTVTI